MGMILCPETDAAFVIRIWRRFCGQNLDTFLCPKTHIVFVSRNAGRKTKKVAPPAPKMDKFWCPKMDAFLCPKMDTFLCPNSGAVFVSTIWSRFRVHQFVSFIRHLYNLYTLPKFVDPKTCPNSGHKNCAKTWPQKRRQFLATKTRPNLDTKTCPFFGFSDTKF